MSLTYIYLSDVFAFVANATSYQNNNLTTDNLPLLNLTGTIPGPLNPEAYVPYLAPNVDSTGAGGGPTFVAPNVNTSLNASTAPAPVNVTEAAGSSTSSTSGAGVGARVGVQSVLGAVFVVVTVGLLF